MKKITQHFEEHFLLSHKSLAIARIGLAILCLCYFVTLWQEVNVFFSDKAIIPYDVLEKMNYIFDPFPLLKFSLTPTYIYFILTLAMLFSFLLLFGWWTRTSIFILWVISLAFFHRFPDLAFAGDNTLKLTLFWFYFLPVSQKFSLDKPRNFTENDRSTRIVSTLWFIQIFLMYFVSFYQKTLIPFWVESYDAIYYVSKASHLLNPVGNYLSVATVITLALELIGPVLLFVPSMKIKRIIIPIFIIFHITIWLLVDVHIFSLLCIIWWITLIPNDKNEIIINNPEIHWKRISTFVLSIIFFLIIIQTINQFTKYRLFSFNSFPGEITRSLQVKPNWNMFTENPPLNYNGWFVEEARFSNGLLIDPTTRKEAHFIEPEDYKKQFPTIHWRTFMRKFRTKYPDIFNKYYSRYLCQKYLTNPPIPSTKITGIRLYFVNQQLSYPDSDFITKDLIFDYSCNWKKND